MRLVKEFNGAGVVCHLVQVVDDFFFTRLVEGKRVKTKNLGVDEEEAIEDFKAEVEAIYLEN